MIVIGIPFAYKKDPKIMLKENYLDYINENFKKELAEKKIHTIKFFQWYSLNAIKLVNQSIGRLIRSVKDSGTIILIDQRYTFDSYRNLISKWIRRFAKIYNQKNIHKLIEDLKTFNEKDDISLFMKLLKID